MQNINHIKSNRLIITAVTAAIEAGNVILEIYNSEDFNVEMKEDNSPLTKADKASHNVIMSHLKETNIPILSEEGRDIPSSRDATDRPA